MIAMVVLSIAMMGVLGLLLVTHQHNASASESTVAYKACQEIMEQIGAMTYDQMKTQDGVTFVATKIHPTLPLGVIQITDISPGGDPDTKSEVQVSITTQPGQYTKQPLNVELVSWRSRR
jgi:Tfp pilus assembly protein PilV